METQAMAGGGSFEEFYSGTVGRLLGQLFPVTGDLHEAEEVVQEAFARAAVRWTRLRDYDVPEAWVRRVAMHLAADRARSLRRQASALLRLSPPPEVPPVSVEALALADALRTLPIRQRQVIVLHHLVDLPVEEVARTLAIRDGTVKSLLARGRRALAAKLGEPAAGLEVVPGGVTARRSSAPSRCPGRYLPVSRPIASGERQRHLCRSSGSVR